MSDRFVSGGTIGSGGDDGQEAERAAAVKNPEWEAVQKELEAERRRRDEARVKAASGEGEQSLYDILQANKAAKQAAFEEQTKVRNQFRALDDDEVGFLDEVREKQKEDDERVRKETEEGLKAFRERQHGGGEEPEPGQEQEGEAWGVGRKRKRVKERDVKGVRRRVSGGAGEKVAGENGDIGAKDEGVKEDAEEKKSADKEKPQATHPPAEDKKRSALVDYGSDDSDD